MLFELLKNVHNGELSRPHSLVSPQQLQQNQELHHEEFTPFQNNSRPPNSLLTQFSNSNNDDNDNDDDDDDDDEDGEMLLQPTQAAFKYTEEAVARQTTPAKAAFEDMIQTAIKQTTPADAAFESMNQTVARQTTPAQAAFEGIYETARPLAGVRLSKPNLASSLLDPFGYLAPPLTDSEIQLLPPHFRQFIKKGYISLEELTKDMHGRVPCYNTGCEQIFRN